MQKEPLPDPADIGSRLLEDPAAVEELRKLYRDLDNYYNDEAWEETKKRRGWEDKEQAEKEVAGVYDSAVETALKDILDGVPTQWSRTPPSPDTPRGAGFDELRYDAGRMGNARSKAVARGAVKNYLTQYRKNERDIVPLDQQLDEAKQALETHIEDLAGQGTHIRITAPMKDILDGGVKTSFETGRGASGRSLREPYEEESMGIPRNLPDHLRPVYGYLGNLHGDENIDNIRSYGTTVLTMKPRTQDRTTVTTTDSLASAGLNPTESATPMKLTEILDGKLSPAELLAMTGRDRNLQQLAEAARNGEPLRPSSTNTSTLGAYTEAQIHGGVPVEDIAAVTYLLDARTADTAQYRMFDISPEEFNAMTDEQRIDIMTKQTIDGLREIGISLEEVKADPELLAALKDVRAAMIAAAQDGTFLNLATLPQWKTFAKKAMATKGFTGDINYETDPKYAKEIPDPLRQLSPGRQRERYRPYKAAA